MSMTRKIFLFWMPIFLYCIVIFIQSSFPSVEEIPALPFMDKYLHFVGYAVLGILFLRAYGTLEIRKKPFFLCAISMISSTLYGISDEIHQSFVPFRNADVMDALANALGSAAGVMIYFFTVNSTKLREKEAWSCRKKLV